MIELANIDESSHKEAILISMIKTDKKPRFFLPTANDNGNYFEFLYLEKSIYIMIILDSWYLVGKGSIFK